MARDVGFKVTGLREKVRSLEAAGVDVEDLKNAFQAISKRGEQWARGFAPQRTGRLASTIRGNRAKSKAVITAGRARVPWAGPINYGWPARNIVAQPFMQQADQRMRPFAEKQLDDEIDQVIRKRGL